MLRFFRGISLKVGGLGPEIGREKPINPITKNDMFT